MLFQSSEVASLSAASTADARPTSSLRVFWITWAGWMLDGFDSSIYVFALVPAVTELLRADGIEPTRGTVALYGGAFFSIFMLGWACSMFWGWLADRIGRVRVMCLTILAYSLFTALCGVATGPASFALFRFLAGFGIGGEWAAGTPLLHESVSERHRVRLAGWLHTATPTGQLLGAAAAFLLPVIGWRGMFFLGVLPALLTIAVRATVREPARTRPARGTAEVEGSSLRDFFVGGGARTTWAAGLMMSCIILGLWSSTYWAPTLIVTKLTAAGSTPALAQRVAAAGGIVANLGTLAGCLAMPFITARIGSRRRTAAAFFVGAFAIDVVSYVGAVIWLDSVGLFVALLPLLGFFTAGVFALYTIWLPEMFPTARRAFGSGFAFSFGRILGALGPSVVGMLVVATGSYPIALALVSTVYLVGLPFIRLAPETAGRPLPA